MQSKANLSHSVVIHLFPATTHTLLSPFSQPSSCFLPWVPFGGEQPRSSNKVTELNFISLEKWGAKRTFLSLCRNAVLFPSPPLTGKTLTVSLLIISGVHGSCSIRRLRWADDSSRRFFCRSVSGRLYRTRIGDGFFELPSSSDSLKSSANSYLPFSR